ncbi:hypothetical protein [Agromyces sp. GXQ0307]|uniref:hypothetical protein n=1 Tax=Agromyces sp. GXQ0307 TaxID=3377835 RepID=UPI00383BB57E
MQGVRALIAPVAVVVLAAPVLAVTSAAPAYAAPDVQVAVTIERIKLLGGDDGCGDPDWYVKLDIAGQAYNNEDTPSQDDWEGNAEITPDWEFSRTVDAATLSPAGQIPISVEVWEEDGGFCFDDDLFDASQSPGAAVAGFATIAPCEAQLDGQTIACGASGVFSGTDADRVELTMKVEVQPPPSAPGLRIRCTHTPAWPQPGDTVTIRAEALDGSLAPLFADDLEIWVQQDTTDVGTRTRVVDTSSVTTATTTFVATGDASDDNRFGYGCGLTKTGTEIFSGWRLATEGDPGTVDFPVVYTGPSSSRLDIMFIADSDTYPFSGSAPENAAFIADVASVIATSYYGFDPFLENQDGFNFWIVLNQAKADDANDGDCDHSLPARWDDSFGWVDSGAILHRKSQRDCALRGDRIFSSTLDTTYRGDAFQVVTHETGHQPFGLADEYCDQRPGSMSSTCDGGYFQQDVAPNVYEEPEDCTDDIGAFTDGRTAASCQEFEEDGFWFFDTDWTISDPVSNDIMVDNAAAQGADLRRFDYIFGQCRAAGC